MSLELAVAALALGLAAAAPPPYFASETVVGHVHVAKTAGTSLNGLLASRYERVCGHKGYSYDSYGANLRMAAGRKVNGRLTAFDSISKIQRGYHRERVPHRVMDEIGFEDCDFISEEQDWRFWRRFEDWPLPLELHVPCRDPLDHLMSQCNYRRRTFNCVDASRSPESLAREVRRCLTFLKRPAMKRFAWDLLGLKNTHVKCYNFSDQFSRYLAHMDKVLQKKRIPAKFIRWETNRPRNVSNECVWSADRGLKHDVVTYLRDNYDYYGFWCSPCEDHVCGAYLGLIPPFCWPFLCFQRQGTNCKPKIPKNPNYYIGTDEYGNGWWVLVKDRDTLGFGQVCCYALSEPECCECRRCGSGQA